MMELIVHILIETKKTDIDKRLEVIAKSDTDLLNDVKLVVESNCRTLNNNET